MNCLKIKKITLKVYRKKLREGKRERNVETVKKKKRGQVLFLLYANRSINLQLGFESSAVTS